MAPDRPLIGQSITCHPPVPGLMKRVLRRRQWQLRHVALVLSWGCCRRVWLDLQPVCPMRNDVSFVRGARCLVGVHGQSLQTAVTSAKGGAPAPQDARQRKFVTSYTTHGRSWQSSGRLCEATAAAEWTVLAGIQRPRVRTVHTRLRRKNLLSITHTLPRHARTSAVCVRVLCCVYSRCMVMILWVLCSRGSSGRAKCTKPLLGVGARSRARGATAGARRQRYRLRAAKTTVDRVSSSERLGASWCEVQRSLAATR